MAQNNKQTRGYELGGLTQSPRPKPKPDELDTSTNALMSSPRPQPRPEPEQPELDFGTQQPEQPEYNFRGNQQPIVDPETGIPAPKSLEPELAQQAQQYLDKKEPVSPIDKAIERGFIETDKEGFYYSNLNVENDKGNAIVKNMFTNVLGADPGWNPLYENWCATFVSDMLDSMGADPLKSNDKFDKTRANAFMKYGTPVEAQAIQEGDIVVLDFDKDGKGDHVTFYAGDLSDLNDPNSNYISVLGGNQDVDRNISIKQYSKEDVLGVRRIQYDNVDYAFTKELSKANPDFNKFLDEQAKDFNWDAFVKENYSMPQEFNQGGMAMDQQMDIVFKSTRGYAEGGDVDPMLMEEGVDPVSGNEVPIGSTPEEVRDDIPAQLSEGEYVVPADVVRYYGVKFFEDLRNQAKTGWEEMNQNGRIGGEPVMQEQDGMEMVEPEDDLPFDISELQTIEAAEGAYISGYAEGGIPSLQDVDIGAGFTGTGVAELPETIQSGQTTVMYSHPSTPENKVALVFMNGEPTEQAKYYIGLGYVPATEVKNQSVQVAQQQQQQVSSDSDSSPSPMPKEEKIDWGTASTDMYEKQLKSLESKLDNRIGQGIAGMVAGPIGGLAAMVGMGNADRVKAYDMLDGIEKQLGSKNTTNEMRESLSKQKDRLLKIVSTGDDGRDDSGLLGKSKIYGGKSSTYEGLVDVSGDGRVTFADTWLGDLLGFDGKVGVQGKDKEGNLLTLSSSREGKRRDEQNAATTAPKTTQVTTPKSQPKTTQVTTPKKSSKNVGDDTNYSVSSSSTSTGYNKPTTTQSKAPSSASTSYKSSTSSAGNTSTSGGKASQSYKSQESKDYGMLNKGGLMMKKKK